MQCGVVTVVSEKPPVATQSCNGAGETARLLSGPKKAFGHARGHLQAVSRMEREPNGPRDGATELGDGTQATDSERNLPRRPAISRAAVSEKMTT